MSTPEGYRESESEIARTADLLRILPRGRRSVLDVGARDGHFSRLLTEYFSSVVALDLNRPPLTHPNVLPIVGDATRLPFADASFDCVFCTEVLEHIPNLEAACREILRVARREIVIGVPFRQDIRVARTSCPACGKVSPPWGHVNSFTEQRLRELFEGLPVVRKSLVGTNRNATNPVSAYLMDVGGNPWGTYGSDETCIHCGARLTAPPAARPLWKRICSGVAARINRIQAAFTKAHANWIHVVFSKTGECGDQ
jgi:SAM-dependent methyltransferase